MLCVHNLTSDAVTSFGSSQEIWFLDLPVTALYTWVNHFCALGLWLVSPPVKCRSSIEQAFLTILR